MDHLFRQTRVWNIRHSQIHRPWFKWVIVLAVLGFSGLLALIGTEQRLIQILALLVILVGLAILLQRPILGLFGILVSAFFIPYTGPGGLNMAVLAVAGVSGLWIIDMIVQQRKIAIAENRVNLPIILFIGSSLVSFGIGQFSWYPIANHAAIDAQIGGLVIFILSAFALLIAGNLIHDLRWLQIFTWLFVGIGALYLLGRMAPPVGNVMRHYFQRGATSGSVFWVWLLVIPFSQALLNRNMHKVWRGALGLLVAAFLYVSILQSYDWKSGFIPPLAGVAFIVAILLKRRVLWFIPLLVAVAIYAGGQAIASDQYSWITRLEAWRIVIDLSLINPLFGIGFANYYWYTSLVPILGWFVSFNSHSQYVDIFSQTGLVGIICFFWIFWEIGKLGWQLKDRVPEGFMKAYVYGVLGGAAGTLVAGGLVDWILPFVYNIGMNGFRSSVIGWLFLGGLISINQIYKNESLPKTSISSIGRQE